MLAESVKSYIDRSVLCWLATSDDNEPNVSPKEIFTYFGDKFILIANISSPQSAKNISKNPKVCVSFVDILIQKGYQLKGRAQALKTNDSLYSLYEPNLAAINKGLFPFSSIFVIEVKSVKQIVAPSYLFIPDTSEADQIIKAKKAYGF